MRVLCRSDASVEIGTGHIYRCVTLARALEVAGHKTTFVCPELPGNLAGWVQAQGFETRTLAPPVGCARGEHEDAEECRRVLRAERFDWIIVDHYELGAAWEDAMGKVADRILAIDDLGRPHRSDLLLDQNCANPRHELYRSAVPIQGKVLLGPRFALLRPEFAKLRSPSLARSRSNIGRLLVFMGGTDPCNETCKALDGICRWRRRDVQVDVVIGEANPHRNVVEIACAELAHSKLHVQTPDIAELMAKADCALGAGGSATWERCALGLPALATILAENQAPIAEGMQARGALHLLGRHEAVRAADYASALDALDASALRAMSKAAAAICDGKGTERVARWMTGRNGHYPSDRNVAAKPA